VKELIRFTKNIGYIGIAYSLVSFSGIILLPILTKTLPIVEYGIWIQTVVIIGLIPVAANLGLPYALIRFSASANDKEIIQEHFYSIACVILLTSAFVSSLFFIFSEPISSALFNNNIFIVQLISIILFFECLNAFFIDFFRTFQLIGQYIFFSVLRVTILFIFIYIFIISGYGIVGAVVGLLLTSLVVFVSQLAVIVYKVGIKIPKFLYIKEHLKFGVPIIPGGLSYWIMNSSDRILIGFFLGESYVGYYAPGYMIGWSAITIFTAPLSMLLPSVLSKCYDENNLNAVTTILKYSFKYFLLFAIPIFFGISLLSKSILLILTTPDIASQGYLIIPFVALSSILNGCYVVIAQILVLKKNTKIQGLIFIFIAIVNFGLNLFFIPYFGILGAAITTLIAFFLVFILISYYSFKDLMFNLDPYFVIKSVIASICMSLLILGWHPEGIIQVGTSIFICFGLYIGVLVLVGGFKKEEVVFLKSILGIK